MQQVKLQKDFETLNRQQFLDPLSPTFILKKDPEQKFVIGYVNEGYEEPEVYHANA